MNVIGEILSASIVRGRDSDVLALRVHLKAGEYEPLRATSSYKEEFVAIEIIDNPWPDEDTEEKPQEPDPASLDSDADDNGRERDDAESVEE